MRQPAVKPELSPGQIYEGFLITRVTPLTTLGGYAVEAVHQASQARFFNICTSDEENLLTIAFRTPPPDNTGVPHILEHAVLCGSRKFPVKDPFVEMLKRSMATFLNAMTGSDITMYPLASNIKADFFNLADVYCDAVFHPRISPDTLRQEGHHLSFARPDSPLDSPLRINGIVYNEMKGAYSNPESYNFRIATSHLFPDSPYGRDSGGDPESIPDLTYDQFVHFYQSFYHPSNARLFTYGDIDPREHLHFLNYRLLETPSPPPRQVDSTVPLQPRWSQPRRIQQPYACDPDIKADRQSMVSLHWLLDPCPDPLTDLAMNLLTRLLLGDASAPLHKAMVDSHLGKGLTCSGYQGGAYETSFHVGLKGTSAHHTEAIEQLVLNTLRQTASRDFDPDRIEVAFHRMQYEHREITADYPLKLMYWTYDAWNYGLDPLTYFHQAEQLSELKSRINRESNWLARLIQEKLLDNPHRLTLTLVPDPELQDQKDQALAARLAARKSSMSKSELEHVKEEADRLAREQELANSEQQLATLPQLPISAIPKAPREIPLQTYSLGNHITFLHNQLFTRQINYTQIGIDLTDLPRELWTWLPLFCILFSQMGTQENNYEIMARRIAGGSSSLRAENFIATRAIDPNQLIRQFTIKLVTLDESLDQALSIVRELLFSLDFSDRQRLSDVIEQAREQILSSIIPNGHRLAALHAGRSISPVSALGELCNGIPQIRLINRLGLDFKGHADELVANLSAIQQFLRQPGRLTISFTGDQVRAERVKNWAVALENDFTSIPRSPQPPATGDLPESSLATRSEGLAYMADVAYCAVCLPAPGFNDHRSVPLKLLAHILNYDYMWERIRVRGGAYGANCNYDPGCSMIKLISHQDPDIVNTMQSCDQLITYLESLKIDHDNLDRARIACARNNQRPLRPGPVTGTSFARYLCGLTREIRRQRRQRLLTATAEEVREIGLEAIRQGMEERRRCVISSRSRLQQANQALASPLQIENLLPS